MKKTVISLMAAVLLFSCAKQELVPVAETTPEVLTRDPWTIVPIEAIEAPQGAPSTIWAGFEETKSVLSMNGAGTYGSIEWQAGDSFYMVGINGTAYYITYQTTGSGASAEFTTSGSLSDEYKANGLWSIAPKNALTALGVYSDTYVLRVTLPQNQTARAGSPDPNALILATWTATQEENLSFRNFVALIKFKLTGANVTNLQSITFTGIQPASGTVPLLMDGDGNPQYLKGLSFGNDKTGRTVTLSAPDGGFVAGTDYYMALLPGTHDGFSMRFSLEVGGDAKTITKNSGKTLTLNRSRITDFGTIAVGDNYDSSEEITPYLTASAGAPKPVTLVVLPEGYTASEMAQYRLDAKSGIDALFNTEPYKTYKNYFNVWILEVASNESGANITDGSGNITTARDCYFHSKWGVDKYGDMAADYDKIFAYVEDHCPDIKNGTHTVEEVPVLLLINDTRYGGIAHTWQNGKTYCMAPKSYGDGTIAWSYASNGHEAASETATPWDTKEVTDAERIALGEADGKYVGTWRNTLVHEFGGHSFGRLADEYWYEQSYGAESDIAGHGYSVPFGLNVSGHYATTPWDDLISYAGTVAADSPYKRIGKFQGGDVSMFYRWRSEQISCMIDNRYYFSAKQRWLIANRIMSLAGLSALTLNQFLANDVTTDPLRDVVSSPVMLPDGVSDIVPPHPAPMLPPPVMHVE